MQESEIKSDVQEDDVPQEKKERVSKRTIKTVEPNVRIPKDKEIGMLDNIKQKISTLTLKPNREKMGAQYDENMMTKASYFFHHVLTFSGKVSRNLMDGYKRLFDFDEQGSGDIYANLGLDLFEKEDYTQAVAAFKKSLELFPENKDVFYYMGNAYFKAKDYKEAANAYLSTIGLEPEHENAHFELGLCYARMEQHTEAIDSYKKAIKLNSENDEIYYSLGVSFDQTKSYKFAIESFKKAIELNPRTSSYYHSLGFTYECIKQHEEAIDCFKKAVEMERG